MTDFYVSLTGNDSTGDGSIGNPFATIQKGTLLSHPGDTTWVRGGIYQQGLNIRADTHLSGTSWAAPVTVRGYPGETVILRPVDTVGIVGFNCVTHDGGFVKANAYPFYYVLQDFSMDGSLNLITPAKGSENSNHAPIRSWKGTNRYTDAAQYTTVSANILATQAAYVKWINIDSYDSVAPPYSAGAHWEFYNCKFRNTYMSHGFYMTATDSIMDGCEFYDNFKIGVQFTDSGHFDINNSIIRACHSHNNGLVGFEMSNGRNGKIYNNIANDNLGPGIAVAAAGNEQDFEIYNNTCYNNAAEGIEFGNVPEAGGGALGNIFIKNNICFHNGQDNIIDGNSPNGGTVGNITVRNNMTGGIINVPASWDDVGGNVVGDPLFVDGPGGNFRLQSSPSVSQAINAGVNLSSIFTTDFSGLTRTDPWDIGAYDSSAITPPPTPSISSITPTTAHRNSTVAIDIFAANTSFGGSTVVDISGDGISKGALSIISSTHCQQIITVESTATLSLRRVTVTTGSEAPFIDGLSILAASGGGGGGTPAITSVLQNPMSPGSSDFITVIGTNTLFDQATTVVTISGTNVTTDQLFVVNATLLAINVNVGLGATPGLRNVTVTTPAQTPPDATALNSFTIDSLPVNTSTLLMGAREG